MNDEHIEDWEKIPISQIKDTETLLKFWKKMTPMIKQLDETIQKSGDNYRPFLKH